MRITFVVFYIVISGIGDVTLTWKPHDEHWLRGVEWVHSLFLFPLVLGKMQLPHAKLGLFCVV